MVVQRASLSNDSDPDIWGVVNLVVCTISMFAQLASVTLQAQSNRQARGLTSAAFDTLRVSIQTAIQHVETLMRLLSRAHGDGVGPLQADFRFGSSPTYFDQDTFRGYQGLVGQIALDAGAISTWTLHIIHSEPGLAEALASNLIAEVTNVQGRINGMFLADRTNESVL